MRIVSDFKDFYDVGRAHDDEDVPVYSRFCVVHHAVANADHAAAPRAVFEAAADLWRDDTVPPDLGYGVPPGVDRCVIGLGGRAFSVYVVAEAVVTGRDGAVDRAPARCCASFDALLRALRERSAWWTAHGDATAGRLLAVLVERLEHPPRTRWRGARARPFDDVLDAASWQRFEQRRSQTVPPRVYVHFQAPLLAHFDDRFIVNPCLKTLGFQSQLPPQQVWQELSLFLGNTLVELSTPAPQPITDALRAETHGFDQQSFRKKKGGRKKLDRSDW